ncbi:BRCA2 and CDKN1A-interacting protein [Trichinella spiralis]|uniref:BRCA2 and CDKN1A-interacting protein n=1 Tax=Trichinella spiralis TaxID=6334 RepID=A0ABR3K8Y1_TRISP
MKVNIIIIIGIGDKYMIVLFSSVYHSFIGFYFISSMSSVRDLIPWPSLSWFLSHIMRVHTPVHELSPSLKVHFHITSPSENQMDGIAFIFRQLFGCGTIDTDRIWDTVLGNHLCFVSNFAIKAQGPLNDEMYNDFFQMIPQAIYGFQACIDLTKRNSAVAQLEKYLIAKCRMSNLSDAQKQQFADMFKMPRRIGLLMNERVDLLPRSVALEAMKYVLFYAADSNFRRFTHYVMMSKYGRRGFERYCRYMLRIFFQAVSATRYS